MYQYELVKAATKLLRDNMGLKKGETVCITADTESHMDVVEATAQAAYALGGKPMVITFAAPRGVDIEALRDPHEEDPKEIEAHKYGLNYIALDGNIACMVNGAGLAMSTMDIIKYYGGNPANFLDVGGSANEEAITQAFNILLKDPHVKGILVNIFGGIMKCDVIAAGVIAAVKNVGLKLPLVVRLEGTNVAQGKKMLSDSGIELTTAESLADAAEKIVKIVAAQNK